VLATAEQILAPANDRVQDALATLRQLALAVQSRLPELPIHFDLAELRGYRYHTGVVFAAYVPGRGQAVAKGGRYDEIGQVFGRLRPATGFSVDLRGLLTLTPRVEEAAQGIYAPPVADPALEALINKLRCDGERVIRALPDSDPGPQTLGCNRLLVKQGKDWTLVSVIS
jgi:ATP phosphoribosyltransferase regulatory subunit